MSLINQMLKDLEKRRSRDLETSPSLSQNITWESGPSGNKFNWVTISVVFTLVALLMVIGYLLWERNSHNSLLAPVTPEKQKQNIAKPAIDTPVVATKVQTQPLKKKAKIKKDLVVLSELEVVSDIDDSDHVEVNDNAEPVKLKKTHRALNNKQLAEIAYKKGYQFLQQGRMHQGKESLRKALSLYIPHIKAREMLAGIYIKSGHFINAAELLNEGVKVVPEYPLFAQLYARVLLEQKNPELAIKILENGSANMEANPDYFALLAATYQRVKKHEKAVNVYLQLVKIRPNTGVIWLGLGISLEKSGKQKEALQAYQRAQQTGNLKAGLVKFTDNRVSSLKEIGFPEENN